ncbi:MAG TPA: prephenate dehydrogenase/arogenate dehydrogenase family protein, partial [Clostridia bacterium]|nr:prephenate dehydrogenase/arogenate dehydrogenase family protein [Clostridia bacterium]
MNDFSKLRIGIAGLGLMGGSLAYALKQRAQVEHIVAVTRKREALDAAIASGAVDTGAADFSVFSDCDIVFVCIPVALIPSAVLAISRHFSGIITDVGSTKSSIIRDIVNADPNIRFVGAHPMTGSEKAGFFAANSEIFENAPYIICPAGHNRQSDIDLLARLVEAIGASPVIMPADKHDRAVGLISHLPHIASAALVGAAANEGEILLARLAAGGFRDITRISSSDPGMWAQIVDSNEMLPDILSEYIACLQAFKAALDNHDKVIAEEFFRRAKTYRDKLKDNAGVQIWVEVEDRPGSIA